MTQEEYRVLRSMSQRGIRDMSKTTPIRNIIFDLGDVLIDYRWQQMLQDYGLSAEEAYRVGYEMFDDPDGIWHIFDVGLHTQEEIIQMYVDKFPEDEGPIRFFIEHGEYMTVPRPEIWARIPRLKAAGYHIYLLSNYPEELFHKHVEYADFMRELDGMEVSYQHHLTKPDRAIYESLCTRYHLDPAECLFYDDRIENVEGAIAYGMQSVQVTGRAMLAAELDRMLENAVTAMD